MLQEILASLTESTSERSTQASGSDDGPKGPSPAESGEIKNRLLAEKCCALLAKIKDIFPEDDLLCHSSIQPFEQSSKTTRRRSAVKSPSQDRMVTPDFERDKKRTAPKPAMRKAVTVADYMHSSSSSDSATSSSEEEDIIMAVAKQSDDDESRKEDSEFDGQSEEDEEEEDEDFSVNHNSKKPAKPTPKTKPPPAAISKSKKRSHSRRRTPKTFEEGDEVFVCDKCGEKFQSGWALGGHASRVHPGESDAYKRKIQRREERTFDRELLALAKQRHAEVYGQNAPINRVKIRKFKREIRNELKTRKRN